MRTVIDFHSHILPDVDDGSRSLEQSLAMLQMEADQGIRRVVATPHFYAQNDIPEKFLRKQEEADRASKAVLEKPKKINYGGLPGTKPKKKK